VLGVNIFSKDMNLEESQQACVQIYRETGLPVEDMVRAPKQIIAEKVLRELFPEMNL